MNVDNQNLMEKLTRPWQAPEIVVEDLLGNEASEKICIVPALVHNANTLFEAIRQHLVALIEKNKSNRVILSLSGGSGSGKTTMAAVIAYYFKAIGIEAYILSGDNYPHRIPMYNDAERLQIYRTGGMQNLASDELEHVVDYEQLQKWQIEEKDACLELGEQYFWMKKYQEGGLTALRKYLGTSLELDFEGVNKVIKEFKSGKEKIWLRHMGRTPVDLWYEAKDLSKCQILIMEWTHGGNEALENIDLSIFLESTPEETLERRLKRNRDTGVDKPFVDRVLEIEQAFIEAQGKNAEIRLSREGEIRHE